MFRKLTSEELQNLWSEVKKANETIASATEAKDYKKLYEASDTVFIICMKMRRHFAALELEKSKHIPCGK